MKALAARIGGRDARQVTFQAGPVSIQRKCEGCQAEDDMPRVLAKGGHEFGRIPIEAPGLVIGRADDPAEREADDIATAILRGDESAHPHAEPLARTAPQCSARARTGRRARAQTAAMKRSSRWRSARPWSAVAR